MAGTAQVAARLTTGTLAHSIPALGLENETVPLGGNETFAVKVTGVPYAVEIAVGEVWSTPPAEYEASSVVVVATVLIDAPRPVARL